MTGGNHRQPAVEALFDCCGRALPVIHRFVWSGELMAREPRTLSRDIVVEGEEGVPGGKLQCMKRKLQLLNVQRAFERECLPLEINHHAKVTRMLRKGREEAAYPRLLGKIQREG